jgi:serine/threonine-protein kinase
MLTGTFPFVAEEVSELFRMHLCEPPPTLEEARPDLGVTPELEAFVRRALAKEPDARFADAGDMRRALRALSRPAAWCA